MLSMLRLVCQTWLLPLSLFCSLVSSSSLPCFLSLSILFLQEPKHPWHMPKNMHILDDQEEPILDKGVRCRRRSHRWLLVLRILGFPLTSTEKSYVSHAGIVLRESTVRSRSRKKHMCKYEHSARRKKEEEEEEGPRTRILCPKSLRQRNSPIYLAIMPQRNGLKWRFGECIVELEHVWGQLPFWAMLQNFFCVCMRTEERISQWNSNIFPSLRIHHTSQSLKTPNYTTANGGGCW